MDFLHWLFLGAAVIFALLAQFYKVQAERSTNWVYFIQSEIERLIEEDRESEA